MTGELHGPPDLGASERRLLNSQAAARRRLQAVWAEDDAPRERYTLFFRSGWAACGEMMAIIARFDVDDIEWHHDPPRHQVLFSSTYAVMKDVQLAALSAGVPKGELHFQMV